MQHDDPFKALDDVDGPLRRCGGSVRIDSFWLIFLPSLTIAAVLFAVVDSTDAPCEIDFWCQFDYWLHRYQALIAAAAAVVTIFVLRGQVLEARSAEARNVARMQVAAREYLPLALTEICEYAEECMRRLDAYQYDTASFELPALPDKAIDAIRACIATAGKEQAVDLAAILSDLQVQRARLRGQNNHLRSTTIPDGIYDSAKIYVRSEALFAWARITSEAARKPTRQRLLTALRVSGIEIRTHPLLAARVEIQPDIEE